jgi:hypothetical protein
MEAKSRVLGQEHPDIFVSMANLASTYRNTGRKRESEELFNKIKDASFRCLG